MVQMELNGGSKSEGQNRIICYYLYMSTKINIIGPKPLTDHISQSSNHEIENLT